MPTFNFTTGPATLPDIGTLSYNGCTFSPLFNSHVYGSYVKDAANRTVKEIEYGIEAEGYVTLDTGQPNVELAMSNLERLLSAPAGKLLYTGRGIKIAVNAGVDKDVAWGPLPELMEITPMGSGGSAFVKWRVVTRIPPRLPKGAGKSGRIVVNPALQFNYESSVGYGEDGYSHLSLRGTLEIPLTRATQADRTVPTTVDDFRNSYMNDLIGGIDLNRFRITKREFPVSRDKRTMEFNVEAEELPWMAMPPNVTIARGTFTFRPAKQGMGLCNWLCTLTCTYTVAKGQPRRVAWLAFLALLRWRMTQGNIFSVIPPPDGNQNPNPVAPFVADAAVGPIVGGFLNMAAQLRAQQVAQAPQRAVWVIDFNGSEGLYLDSKTVTFSATWRLITVFSEILLASGIWRKVDRDNVWAVSMRNISGGQSWLQNRLDPNADIIVDFGL